MEWSGFCFLSLVYDGVKQEGAGFRSHISSVGVGGREGCHVKGRPPFDCRIVVIMCVSCLSVEDGHVVACRTSHDCYGSDSGAVRAAVHGWLM